MIDRTDNYEERREQTEDMLIDAYCKLDDLTRRLMDRQKGVVVLLRRLHRSVMNAEDSKAAADDVVAPNMTADRVILDLLLAACHETFDAMDELWNDEKA